MPTNASFYRVIIDSTKLLVAGAAGKLTALAAASNTGNGTCAVVTINASAVPGVYVITLTAATTFTVTDPNGAITTGATGSGYVGGVSFTITVGTTPFVAGDTFTITVGQGGNLTTLGVNGVNGASGNNGFIDNTTIPQYEVLTAAWPASLANSLAKTRANLRRNEIVDKIHYMANGYVANEFTGTVATAAGPSGTGNGTISTVYAYSGALNGTYTMTFSSATAFTVTDPNSASVGTGVINSSFNNVLNFTIYPGVTAFAANDTFTVAVTQPATQDAAPSTYSFTVEFFNEAAVRTLDETASTATYLTGAAAVQRCVARALTTTYTRLVEYYDPTTAGSPAAARYTQHRDYITAGSIASSLANANSSIIVSQIPNVFWA